jgi:hypothetical protein
MLNLTQITNIDHTYTNCMSIWTLDFVQMCLKRRPFLDQTQAILKEELQFRPLVKGVF